MTAPVARVGLPLHPGRQRQPAPRNQPQRTTSYAYNADNQTCWNYTGASTNSCSSPPSGAHLDTYDLNGNQTSDGNGLTLAYNPLDQTSAINGAPNTYYGQGQAERVSAGGASFQNDILGLSQHVNGGNTDYLTRDPSGQLVDQRTSTSATTTRSPTAKAPSSASPTQAGI